VLVPEQPLGREHGRVLREVLSVHDQVLPVHVHLDVVDALGPQLVDHMQGHPDVSHEDLHRRLRVLVLEEEEDAVLAAALRRLADSLDEPLPTLRIGRLKWVVVALDPRPDDEVCAERAREVGGRDGAAPSFLPRLLVRGREAAAAKAGIEVEPRRDAVDVAVPECRTHLAEVLLGKLLRIVELVAVDEVSEAVDRPLHPLHRRLSRPLRLVAAGDEASGHRAERPDAETGLHR
jgi:hypothetical protein